MLCSGTSCVRFQCSSACDCPFVRLPSLLANCAADFGISLECTGSMRESRTIMGTPLFMAPEVVEGQPHAEKADIWSLGITMIELADGYPPHYGLPPLRVMYIISKDPPPSGPKDASKWSVEFLGFIDACLRKQQLRRPSAVELMGTPFIKNAMLLNGTKARLELIEQYSSARKKAQQQEAERERKAASQRRDSSVQVTNPVFNMAINSPGALETRESLADGTMDTLREEPQPSTTKEATGVADTALDRPTVRFMSPTAADTAMRSVREVRARSDAYASMEVLLHATDGDEECEREERRETTELVLDRVSCSGDEEEVVDEAAEEEVEEVREEQARRRRGHDHTGSTLRVNVAEKEEGDEEEDGEEGEERRQANEEQEQRVFGDFGGDFEEEEEEDDESTDLILELQERITLLQRQLDVERAKRVQAESELMGLRNQKQQASVLDFENLMQLQRNLTKWREYTNYLQDSLSVVCLEHALEGSSAASPSVTSKETRQRRRLSLPRQLRNTLKLSSWHSGTTSTTTGTSSHTPPSPTSASARAALVSASGSRSASSSNSSSPSRHSSYDAPLQASTSSGNLRVAKRSSKSRRLASGQPQVEVRRRPGGSVIGTSSMRPYSDNYEPVVVVVESSSGPLGSRGLESSGSSSLYSSDGSQPSLRSSSSSSVTASGVPGLPTYPYSVLRQRPFNLNLNMQKLEVRESDCVRK
jgi:Protein kinase domain